MEATVGIDIGTTNSYIAINVGDGPHVLVTREGSTALPAVVAVAENGRRVVGAEARAMAVSNAPNTVFGVTRLLGLPASSEQVKSIAARVPFRMARGPEDAVFIRLPGWNATPAEIGAMILEAQRKLAEEYLEAEVDRAVLTVPTYYDKPQEQGLVAAARAAGFREVSTIAQTVAAAHAHGYMDKPGSTVAVYHLGGGTFEVALLSIGALATEVVGSGGDPFLGGDAIDDMIVDWFVSRTLEEHGFDISGNTLALQSLRPPVRQAKCRLTTEQEAEVRLPFVDEDGETLELCYPLTRAMLVKMATPCLERTVGITREMLRQAGVGPTQIDDVLLVGGQSRMPLVQQTAARLFGRQPTLDESPESTIALGACIGSSALEDEALELDTLY